jgi:purine-nucleoside/S-methyl-5'-thioadenosine phosphorylase / adenosine deaminase
MTRLFAPAALALQTDLLARSGRLHGFTTRLGGVSTGSFGTLNLSPKWPEEAENVAANYDRLAQWAGFDGQRLYLARQVHGAQGVQVLDQTPAVVRPQEADYLFTDRPGVTVAVITADCVPLLMADPKGRGVAAVHAGWRGLVAGVIGTAVRSLGEVGGRPEDLVAGLGPCIGPCCFEVGQEVVEAFVEAFPSHPDIVVPAQSGPTPFPKPHVNLWRAARTALEEAGLDPAHIADPPGCTLCDPERFYSYRRDGARIGQQLAYISPDENHK